MKTRTRALGWAALVALMAIPMTLQAQDTHKTGCLRGQPLPACRSFWIFEVQGASPLSQTDRFVETHYDDQPHTYRQDAFENVLEWNLGHMVNLGEKWALGGEVTVSTSGIDGFGGFRGRVRRWITPDLSLEAEGGMLALDVANVYNRRNYGYTADLRLNIRDQGSFFVRWDGIQLPTVVFPGGYSDLGGDQHAFYVGASAGSVPALIGTGVGGLAYLMLWAIFVGIDD